MEGLGQSIVVLENEDGVGGIDRRRNDGVVLSQYLITVPEIPDSVMGQGAGKQHRMFRMTLRLRRFVIENREIVALSHQVDRRNHFAKTLLRGHAKVVRNLKVLLPDFVVMRDGRELSRLRRERRLQVGGHILMHRLEFHVNNGRLVAEKHVFLAEQIEQIRWQRIRDERDVLWVIDQNRPVAFLEARRQGQQGQSHPNQTF